MTILTGDCRHLMPAHGPFDLILADPPYGDTSLAWDRRVDGRITRARDALRPTGSLWVFGSLRCFMATADRFADAGLRVAQEIVWEKQNGSSFHADRFKRVHELAVQFYPIETLSALLEILIRTSCPQGALVGDWFAGSGVAGEACRLSGRRYLGCEIDAAMAERARTRITAVLPFYGGDSA